MAVDIKKQIIENYYKGNDFLITYANLELFIKNRLGISLLIDHENSQMYKYFINIVKTNKMSKITSSDWKVFINNN